MRRHPGGRGFPVDRACAHCKGDDEINWGAPRQGCTMKLWESDAAFCIRLRGGDGHRVGAAGGGGALLDVQNLNTAGRSFPKSQHRDRTHARTDTQRQTQQAQDTADTQTADTHTSESRALFWMGRACLCFAFLRSLTVSLSVSRTGLYSLPGSLAGARSPCSLTQRPLCSLPCLALPCLALPSCLALLALPSQLFRLRQDFCKTYERSRPRVGSGLCSSRSTASRCESGRAGTVRGRGHGLQPLPARVPRALGARVPSGHAAS